MKRSAYLRTLLLSAICAAIPEASAAAPAASAAVSGSDRNGDHIVDAADAQAFLDEVAAGTPPAGLDLDKDGKVGLSDALLFGRWVNGLHEDQAAGLSALYFRNPADTAAYAAYQENKKNFASWKLADLRAHYPDASIAPPEYAPGRAAFESEIGKAMARWAGPSWPRDAFMARVLKEGAAVSEAVRFPNYFQALDNIHQADLPLLVTTDALLHTVYLSYDNILMELEENLFAPSLDRILLASEEYAEKNYGDGEQGKDVREMLQTALFLLNRTRKDLVADPAVAEHLKQIDAAVAKPILLFGRDTTIDFSQFTPRGHYTRSPALKAYFQGMMWLSRADLAFDMRPQSKVRYQASFTRMKKDALVLWDCVVNSGSYPAWLEINRYVEYLVGMGDGLNLKGMGVLASELGVRDVPGYIASFPEARFDSTVAAGRFGAQAILSQAKVYDHPTDDLDLSPICNFMPQRFILDSYTFSQTVYPLTQELMPNALQIAFALGDNSALAEMPAPSGNLIYPVLGAQRALYDAISPEGWQSNLYTSWLGFLRKLNPADGNPKAARAFRTRAWQVKMRNTRLTSWAQLRHNTILYAKQSYTGGITCSFPKAYVEPYPEFFAAVAAYARVGAAAFKTGRPAVAAYFTDLERICNQLQAVAARSAGGLGPTEAQGAWLTTALSSTPPTMCGGARVYDGWYVRLNYKPSPDMENTTDYTIADVHTHLLDEAGPDMVLHEASGPIHLAAVAVEEDSCVTLYVGPVGSFYELTRTGDLKRYTDEEWTDAIVKKDALATRPAWTAPMMGP